MDAIKSFLKKYNLTTHTVVVVGAFLVGAFYGVPAFHDVVISAYNATPAWVHTAITVGLALYAWYRKGAPASDATKSSGPSTAQLGAIMLCALTVLGTMPLAGCSGTQVAQDIVNWTPALQAAVATVDSSVTLVDPAAGAILIVAVDGFDAASNELVAQANAYLASPKDATVLARLQTAVSTFQQTVNAAALAAVHISNPTSQTHALNAINGVAVILSTLLGLVSSISSKTAITSMSQNVTTKLAMIEPRINREQAITILATHYDESRDIAAAQYAMGETALSHAGF